MIQVLKNNAKLYMTWLIMTIFILVGVATTGLLSFVALAIFGLFVVFSPINDSCALLFGLLPLANIFKYQAGATSFFTICELLIVLVAIFKDRKIKINFLISLLLLVTYLFISDLPNLNFLAIIKIIMGFYLIYLLSAKANKEDIVNIAYLLSLSIILMMFLSMNNSYFQSIEPYLTDLNYLLNSAGNASDTMRVGGFSGDPNYCSMLIIITVALLCVLYYYKKIKTEFWVFIGFLIPLGFFTYSKSYFLCISLLILFLIFFVLLPKYKGWGIVSIFAVVIVASMALSGKIEVINLVLKRFSMGDITTGRTELNRIYLTYIFKNPMTFLFGEGIGADRIASVSNNVHNIYIEGLFRLGLVGCALYLSTLLISITSLRKRKVNRKFVNYFPLIFLMILYLALAGITMYELPFYLSIAFLAMNFNSIDENSIAKDNLIRR